MSEREVSAIVWFRRDLRVSDHAALSAAVESASHVVPLFIFDDDAAGAWAPGGAARWWLHHSLEAHGRSLEDLGSRLILRRGDSADVLARLAEDTSATHVYCSRSYEPWAARLEARVRARLANAGVTLKRFAGTLLHEPDRLLTKARTPYKVFTPFWRALGADGSFGRPLAPPKTISPPGRHPKSDRLGDWDLLPTKPDWAGGLRARWSPGEEGAKRRLKTFVSTAIGDYAVERERPDRAGTSQLSPHLAFGEIGPRQCWWSIKAHLAQAGAEKGAETFLKELAWREFSAHLLHHWPRLPEDPFRDAFAAFPWKQDDAALRAWQRGLTGYPMVDAGMRELWATGYMHNRVRMIVASFLIKHLLQPWQTGEAWFWDTLVDADLASNAANWQWVAGSGADAAPYFRIFNPVTQGKKFDPNGDYVRRWVPELSALPAAAIHTPWEAPSEVLAAAGVKIGDTYPAPLVDHAAARGRALEAFNALKARD